MAWIAGVDGCRGGWMVAREDLATGRVALAVVTHFGALLELRPRLERIGVDIPIGLPDAGARTCDVLARRRLGPRAGSRVFPAPVRRALRARSYEEACRLSLAVDGRSLSRQAFGILAKIREVDACLERAREGRIYEVHPELAFMELAGASRALPPKRTARGRALRLRLLRRAFPALELPLRVGPRARVAPDDVLDALAVLWSTRRIARGDQTVLPARPPRDRRGLRMAIFF